MIRVNINGSRFIKFQSLFSWNLLLMNERGSDHVHGPGVSILVFVELALDGLSSAAWPELHRVSILVFVELALDERLFFVLFPV